MSGATNDVNRPGLALRVRMQRARRVAVRAGACLLGWTVLSWLALATANAATVVSGTIATNTTWVASQSPYVVSADITVDAGALLTIQPGVIVTMNAGANLIIKNGGLNAQGTSSAPITITSYRDVANPNPAPAPGDWGQVQFLSGTQTANTSLNYVTVKYGSGMVLTGASPTLNNLSVLNQNGPAIAIDLNSSPTGAGLVANANTVNGIAVPSGDITGSVSWGLQGIPYVVAQGIVGVGQLQIDLNPHSLTLTAGTSGTLQVSVANAAPAQGLAIDVVSSDVTVATVSATVTVPAGATSVAIAVNGQTAGNGTTTVTASRAGLGTASASVQVSGQPDLTLSSASVGTIVKNADASFNIPVTFTVSNAGGVAAQPAWYDLAYLSSNGILDNTSVNLTGNNQRTTSLAPGGSYTVTVTFKTSTTTAAGNYTLFIKTDGHGSQVGGTNIDNGFVAESNETNNMVSQPITLSALPDLKVSNASVGQIAANQNGSFAIPVTFTVINQGGLSAQPTWHDPAYLSTSGVLDNSAQVLGGYHNQTTVLAPGASYTVTQTYTTSASTADGNYTLFVKADGHDNSTGGTPTDNGNVSEGSETNNTQSLAVTLSHPDLILSNASIGTVVANQNGSFNIPVTFTVTNQGGLSAQPTWHDPAYLSTSGVLDNSAQVLGGYHNQTTVLAPGASYTVTQTYTASASTADGNYTLFVKADGHDNSTGGTPTDNGNVSEGSETNNTQSLAVTLSHPDLILSNASIGTVVANQNGSFNIPVTFTVTNQGGLSAQPTWHDPAYLSTSGVLDNSAQVLGGYHNQTTVLAPGASYTVTQTYTTSASTADGNYTLFVKADGHDNSTGGTPTDNGNVSEGSETNNTQSLAVTLSHPDLILSNPSVGQIVANQNGSFAIPVTFTVTNQGGLTAQSSWYDMAYLSTNGVLDNNVQPLGGYRNQATPLAPGASYTVTQTFTTSASTADGNYTLFVKADGNYSPGTTGGTPADNGRVSESNETNNAQSLAVTLSHPDLILSNPSVGQIVANQNGSFAIPVTFTVTNQGGLTAQSSWYDMAYLSTNGVLDNNVQPLGGYRNQATPLAPGASYTVTQTFATSASTADGNYTLFVKADGNYSPGTTGGTPADNGRVSESNETNNVAGMPITLPPH